MEKISSITELEEKRNEIASSPKMFFISELPFTGILKPKLYFEKKIHLSNVSLVSFGNEKYNNSQYRFFTEACKSNFFDKVIAYNQQSLQNDTNFWNKHGEFLTNNSRGYGYWLWKPFVILQTLKSSSENDILVYADTGCSINNNGCFDRYKPLLEKSASGVLVFEFCDPHNNESRFTKMDTFVSLGAEHLTHSRQLCATVIFFRVCKEAIEFVEKWYNNCSNYHLLDDSPSVYKDDVIFKDHRHDQSILSLLAKLERIPTIPCDIESRTVECPIWAMRIRN